MVNHMPDSVYPLLQNLLDIQISLKMKLKLHSIWPTKLCKQ